MADDKTDETPGAEAPLLDLKTLVERPRIRIDGETYEMLSPDELSVVDLQRLSAWGRRVDKLLAKPDFEPGEETELERLLRDLCALVLVGVPDAVRDRLSDQHRLDVIESFTTLPRLRRPAAEAAGAKAETAKAAETTGARPPPGSAASIAGRRGRGSPRSRPRS